MPETFYTLERRLRAEMKQYIRDQLATMVKLQPYSANSADGTKDKIQGYQTEGSDEQAYDFDGRRIFPFGLRSRPPSGTFGVWIGMGGESGNGVIIAAESSRFGPSNLNDGEVAIYNKVTGCGTLYDQNGNIIHTPASGQTVQLGGNAHPLPLWDTFLADLKTLLTDMAGASPIVVGNTGVPTAPFTTHASAIITKINGGNYSSTVAQNG